MAATELHAIWWDRRISRWRWSVRAPGRPAARGIERTRDEAEAAASWARSGGVTLALPRKVPAHPRGPRLGSPDLDN